MNDNIDIRMSNYLTILSNKELRDGFDSYVIRNMENAVVIYATKTSAEYVQEYKRQQASQQQVEEVNKMFK